jgi:sn1-specific diacylglycerol lipase
MPAIVLFQRRTFIAGDDLHPAAILSVTLHTAQLTLFLGPIYYHIVNPHQLDYSDENCQQKAHLFSTLLLFYAVISTVAGAANIVLNWRLAYWSSQGSPTEPEPRTTRVTKLLERKLHPLTIAISVLVWVTGVSVTAMGLASRNDNCEVKQQDDDDNINESTGSSSWELWWFTLGFMLVTQLLEWVGSVVYLLHLWKQDIVVESLFGSGNEDSLPIHMTSHELIEEMWAERCARACHCLGYASCFVFGGRDLLGQGPSDAFGDVARALADYLETRGVLDLVPSDIMAGLVVLQKLQRQRIRTARADVVRMVSVNTDIDSRENIGDSSMRADENAVLVGDHVLMPLEDPMSPTEQLQTVDPRSVYRRNSQGAMHQLSRSVLQRNNPIDMTTLEEGARYAKFALAIYTWVLYVYEHPMTGLGRLAWEACSSCCKPDKQNVQPTSARRLFAHQGRIDEDNMWQMHKHALLLTAGLENADLVYAQLRSGFTENPYCILLDHEWNSVVVSIRGTFSLEDMVTDVLIDPESVEELGEEFGFDGKGQYAHGGVLACVRNVYRDLQRHRLLEHLLQGEDAAYPDYTLRLVGHSLGAATCTVLSYMLRSSFPNLRCINYGPPGCCLSWEMATACHSWCSTFIVDTDLLSRLNRDSMESLRDEVLEVFGRIKVPKIEIVERLLNGGSLEDILYSADELPDSEYRQRLARFKAIQSERRLSRGSLRDVRLYPPGKIVHLVKTGEKSSCLHGIHKCLTCWTTNVGFEYAPVLIENDDLNEIVVSSTMVSCYKNGGNVLVSQDKTNMCCFVI